jgi:outer membrane biosynthesis protein TonB
MNTNKILTLLVIVIVIVAAALAVAAPAFAVATASCEFNAQYNAWHIVGGGQTNDHWYDTEAECLIALQVPTAMATLMATTTATTVPTDQPTATEPPTATEAPTEPPVATETPTEPPTAEPTLDPTQTPVVTPFPTREFVKPRRSCESVWTNQIVNTVHKDEGYRYFDKRPWCAVWLMRVWNINYDQYKIQHPLD